MMLYFLLHFTGLSYPLVVAGWLMASLPLICTGLVLQGRSKDWEFYRLVLAWVGCALAWGLMSPMTVAVYGSYLLLNSLAYFLWLARTPAVSINAS